MPRVRKGDVVWVEPKLVAEVEFVEWTHDGHLRAPVLQGAARGQGGDRGAPRGAERRDRIRKGKRVLKLSNLDKLFWPEEGITKGDLLSYYQRGRARLVPHLKDRPFTMKRYPDGWQGKFFFQKDAPKGMPDWIPTALDRRLDARQAAPEAADRRAARERRARAALDGEHGLHRHEHVVLADRQARAARLRALRPRPVTRRRVPRDDRGRAAREAGARRARARELRQDERRRRGSTSSFRSRAATRTPTRASSRRSSRARSRGRTAAS